jgi:hypothetical protein
MGINEFIFRITAREFSSMIFFYKLESTLNKKRTLLLQDSF